MPETPSGRGQPSSWPPRTGRWAAWTPCTRLARTQTSKTLTVPACWGSPAPLATPKSLRRYCALRVTVRQEENKGGNETGSLHLLLYPIPDVTELDNVGLNCLHQCVDSHSLACLEILLSSLPQTSLEKLLDTIGGIDLETPSQMAFNKGNVQCYLAIKKREEEIFRLVVQKAMLLIVM